MKAEIINGVLAVSGFKGEPIGLTLNITLSGTSERVVGELVDAINQDDARAVLERIYNSDYTDPETPKSIAGAYLWGRDAT